MTRFPNISRGVKNRPRIVSSSVSIGYAPNFNRPLQLLLWVGILLQQYIELTIRNYLGVRISCLPHFTMGDWWAGLSFLPHEKRYAMITFTNCALYAPRGGSGIYPQISTIRGVK